MEYSEKITKFLFKNKLSSNDFEQIRTAFTHPSFTNEKGLEYTQNYERLEFLGDAVLKLISSNYLFKKYPDFHEGELTRIRSILVSDACLGKFAKSIDLEEMLVVGNVDFRGKSVIPESVLACAFEALLGALYLSSEFSQIETFLVNFFEQVIDEIKENQVFVNAKATLQEYTQSIDKTLPIYETVNEFGPEHNKTFEVEVYYQQRKIGSGSGKNKKEAQQNAAANACQRLKLLEVK